MYCTMGLLANASAVEAARAVRIVSTHLSSIDIVVAGPPGRPRAGKGDSAHTHTLQGTGP